MKKMLHGMQEFLIGKGINANNNSIGIELDNIGHGLTIKYFQIFKWVF